MYDLLPYSVKVFRISDEKQIEGIPFQAFYCHSFTHLSGLKETYYHSTTLIVYKDGLIHYRFELITFEELMEKLSSGEILIELPENSSLSIINIGYFEVTGFISFKTIEDFVKEIKEAINVLNGGTPKSTICFDAFKKYLLNDSTENFEELSLAFYALPSHKRMIIEGSEHKDPLLKLMSDPTSIFTVKERRYMLNDYFDEEWTEEEFKVSDNKN